MSPPRFDPTTLHLPTATSGLDQHEEWCELEQPDGTRKWLRFHDYPEIYAVPGLYEHLFGDRLECSSPTVVGEALSKALADAGRDPASTSVLDFGAGNGMVGERLREHGIGALVGVDLLPEARDAAARDRPGVYDDYLAADFTTLTDADRDRLGARTFDAMTCVAALGFGDIPTLAFVEAYNLVDSPGLVAFNLRDKFFEESDASGFGDLLRRAYDDGLLTELSRVLYRHRLSVDGKALDYLCVVARKNADLPLEWAA